MGNVCFLHVGMHKTGSSAIQNSLHGYDDGQTEYLDVKQPNHSQILVASLMPDLENYSQIQRLGLGKDEIKNFKKNSHSEVVNALKMASSKNKNVIISAEYFSHPGEQPRDNLIRLKSLLESYFEKIKVIAYARSPKSFMESALQERIKGGDTEIDLNSLYPLYKARFEKLYRIFGSQNVSIYKYEPRDFVQGNVVTDFSCQTGLDASLVKSVNSNEKINFEALSLLYSYASLVKKIHPTKRYIFYSNRLITKIKKRSNLTFSISDDVVNNVINENINDVKWMENIVGEFSEPSRKASDITVGSLDDFFNFTKNNRSLLNAVFEDAEISKELNYLKSLEAFLDKIDADSVSVELYNSELEVLRDLSGRPQVVFREFAKLLYRSGCYIESLSVIDEGLKVFPAAKGLKQLRGKVKKMLEI